MVQSCDSNDVTPMLLAALGDEQWKFRYFCSESLLFGIPRAPRDVLYIIGKVFLKEIQRRRDRGERCSSYGGNPRLRFTDLDPEGELAFISLSRPSGCPVGDLWIP